MSLRYAVLAFYLAVVPFTYGKSSSCNLNRTFEYDDMEPTMNPLIIHVKFEILHIRDVPNSGGSFGVDIK